MDGFIISMALATLLLISVGYEMVANPIYIEIGRKPTKETRKAKQNRRNNVNTYRITITGTYAD